MKNEKWNSSWSIKRKTPTGVEIDELIDSRAFSVEVGGKFEIKGAQRPSEIYSPRPVEVNRGTTGREIQRERGGNRPWNGRWSRCALPTRNWPPWSDCIHRFNTYSRRGRETGSKILVSRFHFPRSRVFLVRIRSHSIISRRISNEMGTGFA